MLTCGAAAVAILLVAPPGGMVRHYEHGVVQSGQPQAQEGPVSGEHEPQAVARRVEDGRLVVVVPADPRQHAQGQAALVRHVPCLARRPLQSLFVVLLFICCYSISIAVIWWQWYAVWDEKEKVWAYTFNDSRDL